MSEHFIAGPTEIYFATATTLFLGAVVLSGLAMRQSGRKRTLLLVATLPMASMGVAYIFMALELFTVEVTATGRFQSVARFVGYTLVLGSLVYLERDLIDLTTRQTAITLAFLLVTPWASLFSWMTTGTLESLMNVAAILAYLVAAYILFVPHNRVAREVSPERRLLFAKIRNLFVLSLGALITLSAVSEQSLGLMDFFVGQVAASYADIVFLLGIGGLAYSGRVAFEQAGDTQSENPTENEDIADNEEPDVQPADA